ncbi:hypothetical protein GCM10010080_16670 [Thermomonas carbonis]|nr:hypothetical protein GCM10010080_16670 [Thermomonas carbonis]
MLNATDAHRQLIDLAVDAVDDSPEATQVFQYKFAHVQRLTLLPNPTTSVPLARGRRQRSLSHPHVILLR